MKKREVKLNLFDVQTTGQASLSAEMKTFYENTLIDMAEPKLVHDRFQTNIRYQRITARR